jgi:hypothetical protein
MSLLIFPDLPGLKVLSRERIDNASVFETASGKEQRVGRWVAPRYRYRLGFGSAFLRSAAAYQELQALEGFASRMRGRLDTFMWSDPEDYTYTAHPFGVGDGTVTEFQLQRSMVPSASLPGAASRVYWPVVGDGYEPCLDLASSPAIYKDGTLQTGDGTDYQLGANGLVLFVSAPAAGAVLTWTGTYWKRCRFDSDSVGTERIVPGWWKSGGVDLVTVPVGGGAVTIIGGTVSYNFPGAVLYP